MMTNHLYCITHPTAASESVSICAHWQHFICNISIYGSHIFKLKSSLFIQNNQRRRWIAGGTEEGASALAFRVREKNPPFK